jgi:hypothetical protein
MTTQTTGFAVVADDKMAIYAVGQTEAAARADYERQSATHWGEGSERTVPATARLIAHVEKHGGAPSSVRWTLIGGVADLADAD